MQSTHITDLPWEQAQGKALIHIFCGPLSQGETNCVMHGNLHTETFEGVSLVGNISIQSLRDITMMRHI